MSNFRTFKHRVTGKYGVYPAHFEAYPDFILCEPETCTDCQIIPDEVPEEIPDPEETLDDYREEDESQW